NIFSPLLSGHVLVFPNAINKKSPNEKLTQLNTEHVLDSIYDQHVNLLSCTPSEFYELLKANQSFEKLVSLRYLFLSGEPIHIALLQTWWQQSQCRIINCYSLKGCTDIVSAYELNKTYDYQLASVPIGKPIPNVQVYLLDAYLQLAPIGAHAQLYIAGDTLGKIYTDGAVADQKTFIDNPIA